MFISIFIRIISTLDICSPHNIILFFISSPVFISHHSDVPIVSIGPTPLNLTPGLTPNMDSCDPSSQSAKFMDLITNQGDALVKCMHFNVEQGMVSSMSFCSSLISWIPFDITPLPSPSPHFSLLCTLLLPRHVPFPLLLPVNISLTLLQLCIFPLPIGAGRNKLTSRTDALKKMMRENVLWDLNTAGANLSLYCLPSSMGSDDEMNKYLWRDSSRFASLSCPAVLFLSLLFLSYLFYSLLSTSFLLFSSLIFTSLFFSFLLFSYLFFSFLFFSFLFFSFLFFSFLLFSSLLFSSLLFSSLFFSSLLFSSLFLFLPLPPNSPIEGIGTTTIRFSILMPKLSVS